MTRLGGRPALFALVASVASIACAGSSVPGPIPAAATDARCTATIGTPLDQGRVAEARIDRGGSVPSPKTAAFGLPTIQLPPSCRVTIVLTPSADSHITTEVWMPAEGWNGRLQAIGNGGYAGSIKTEEMTVALRYHYAVTSTATGHRGADYDASWALGHPEKLKDYSWRAIHLTAVAAKRVVAAYYDRPARYAYFFGGSNGGRQALTEAQRFPADYDGIVAGAPALDAANDFATDAWIEAQLMKDPAGFIPASKSGLIDRAVMTACDGLDGVVDGLLEDPLACTFDPATLACSGADADTCLTAAQVAWLRNIYAGPGGAHKGRRYRGYERGNEGVWVPLWFAKRPQDAAMSFLPVTFYRDIAYGKPGWSLADFSFRKDAAAGMERARALGFDATDPDLSRFHALGGKLIIYQGWSDPAVSPRMPIDYVERVRHLLGAHETDAFVRLYMAPGMAHVIGGPGPNAFGQMSPGGASDARHSVSSALEAWVERGIAPGAIVAGKYVDDVAPLLAPGSLRPIRERPLCPYPQVAHWDGHGSIDDAISFACVAAVRLTSGRRAAGG